MSTTKLSRIALRQNRYLATDWVVAAAVTLFVAVPGLAALGQFL